MKSVPDIIKIETILITYRRPELLRQCLESLEAAADGVLGRIHLKILIGINGPGCSSLAWLEERGQTALPNLEYEIIRIGSPLKPSAARNRLVAKASESEWLFFIDDDAFIEADFFRIFLSTLEQHQDASVIGGPNLTPLGSSVFQRASGAALSSRFGAAASCVRYRPRTFQAKHCGDESLILCNMFVRTRAMKANRFPEGLICNEENWILQDFKRQGHILIYEPTLYVWHERRRRPLAFAAQIHKYGIGRGQNLRLRPKTFQLRHVVPALSLLFTVFSVAVAAWMPSLGHAWLALLAAYVAIWTSATARLKNTASENLGVCLVGGLLFPLIHLTYGTGVLRGLTFSDRQNVAQ